MNNVDGAHSPRAQHMLMCSDCKRYKSYYSRERHTQTYKLTQNTHMGLIDVGSRLTLPKTFVFILVSQNSFYPPLYWTGLSPRGVIKHLERNSREWWNTVQDLWSAMKFFWIPSSSSVYQRDGEPVCQDKLWVRRPPSYLGRGRGCKYSILASPTDKKNKSSLAFGSTQIISMRK